MEKPCFLYLLYERKKQQNSDFAVSEMF